MSAWVARLNALERAAVTSAGSALRVSINQPIYMYTVRKSIVFILTVGRDYRTTDTNWGHLNALTVLPHTVQ